MATPSSETQNPSPQQQSPLLRLPAEIRNHIYEDFFNLVEEIHVGINVIDLDQAIVQTCKQIRQDALALMYATCKFELVISQPSMQRTIAWLSTQSSIALASIPALRIYYERVVPAGPEYEAVVAQAKQTSRRRRNKKERTMAQLFKHYLTLGQDFVDALYEAGIPAERMCVGELQGVYDWSSLPGGEELDGLTLEENCGQLNDAVSAALFVDLAAFAPWD